MDYAALRAADRALGIADLVQACAALNAQTRLATVDVPAEAVFAVLEVSREWAKVKQAAGKVSLVTSLDVGATAAAAIYDRVINMGPALPFSRNDRWAAFAANLATLATTGLVAQASVDAITALRTALVPMWPEVITPGLLQMLRSST